MKRKLQVFHGHAILLRMVLKQTRRKLKLFSKWSVLLMLRESEDFVNMGRGKKKTKPYRKQSESNQPKDGSCIFVKLDKGVWWPGYASEGKGYFYDEDEYITLNKSNWKYTVSDEQLRKSLDKLKGRNKRKFFDDLEATKSKKGSGMTGHADGQEEIVDDNIDEQERLEENSKIVKDGQIKDDDQEKIVKDGQMMDDDQEKIVKDGKMMDDDQEKIVKDGQMVDDDQEKIVMDGQMKDDDQEMLVEDGELADDELERRSNDELEWRSDDELESITLTDGHDGNMSFRYDGNMVMLKENREAFSAVKEKPDLEEVMDSCSEDSNCSLIWPILSVSLRKTRILKRWKTNDSHKDSDSSVHDYDSDSRDPSYKPQKPDRLDDGETDASDHNDSSALTITKKRKSLHWKKKERKKNRVPWTKADTEILKRIFHPCITSNKPPTKNDVLLGTRKNTYVKTMFEKRGWKCIKYYVWSLTQQHQKKKMRLLQASSLRN
ncbi:uncharacterized protein LOC117332874 [Pecten maximus]|uniref:uncharacterized protein LOC117332874 n=1 Tax=Pecten maximus TaxID=6579 RepID=UPI0014585143|nr:uncharacterized protein LOC117332874 [Pecten maximus]